MTQRLLIGQRVLSGENHIVTITAYAWVGSDLHYVIRTAAGTEAQMDAKYIKPLPNGQL